MIYSAVRVCPSVRPSLRWSLTFIVCCIASLLLHVHLSNMVRISVGVIHSHVSSAVNLTVTIVSNTSEAAIWW